MSLPTWAKMPVIGATKPMVRSSALAGAVEARPSARQLPSSIFCSLLVIVFPPLLSWPPCSISGRLRCQFLRTFAFALSRETLANAGGDSHQPHRQIEDRQHIGPAERVLPPRHQRAEIFAQTEDDGG